MIKSFYNPVSDYFFDVDTSDHDRVMTAHYTLLAERDNWRLVKIWLEDEIKKVEAIIEERTQKDLIVQTRRPKRSQSQCL